MRADTRFVVVPIVNDDTLNAWQTAAWYWFTLYCGLVGPLNQVTGDDGSRVPVELGQNFGGPLADPVWEQQRIKLAEARTIARKRRPTTAAPRGTGTPRGGDEGNAPTALRSSDETSWDKIGARNRFYHFAQDGDSDKDDNNMNEDEKDEKRGEYVPGQEIDILRPGEAVKTHDCDETLDGFSKELDAFSQEAALEDSATTLQVTIGSPSETVTSCNVVETLQCDMDKETSRIPWLLNKLEGIHIRKYRYKRSTVTYDERDSRAHDIKVGMERTILDQLLNLIPWSDRQDYDTQLYIASTGLHVQGRDPVAGDEFDFYVPSSSIDFGSHREVEAAAFSVSLLELCEHVEYLPGDFVLLAWHSQDDFLMISASGLDSTDEDIQSQVPACVRLPAGAQHCHRAYSRKEGEEYLLHSEAKQACGICPETSYLQFTLTAEGMRISGPQKDEGTITTIPFGSRLGCPDPMSQGIFRWDLFVNMLDSTPAGGKVYTWIDDQLHLQFDLTHGEGQFRYVIPQLHPDAESGAACEDDEEIDSGCADKWKDAELHLREAIKVAGR